MKNTFFHTMPFLTLLLSASVQAASGHHLDVRQSLPWQVDARAHQVQVHLGPPPPASPGSPLTLRLELHAAPAPWPTGLQVPLQGTAFTLADLLGSELRADDYVAWRTFVGLHAGREVEISTLVGRPGAAWPRLAVEIEPRQHKLVELRYLDAQGGVVRRLVCGGPGRHGEAGACTLYSELPDEPPVSRLQWFVLTGAKAGR